MIKKLPLFLFLLCLSFSSFGQDVIPDYDRYLKDSVIVRVHPSYDSVSGFHRWLFGENYRKDWAMPVKLPVIKLSELVGGLTPEREGGGMQSKSLRLKDKNGKEWVLRSVEKVPDKLLPPTLRGTFVLDWVGDEFSGQHPYSALIVPPLARAADVPHAHPIIGVVAADPVLGEYNKVFANLVCLFEEREPTGESDNTLKMERELVENHNNRFDGDEFLRARMLDLLIADWDRHEDQWRWAYTKTDKAKIYNGVPRDRDQVFHIVNGVFPTIAALPWLDPTLENFSGDIPHVQYGLYKTRFIKQYPDAQMAYAHWMQVVHQFVAAETDSVLEAGLQQLPRASYLARHDELLNKLKARRNNLPYAMDQYYRFINQVIDVRASDKNELVTVTDADSSGMRVIFQKLTAKLKPGDTIMNAVFYPYFTHEVRLYLGDGDDRVVINTAQTPIKLRIVGVHGEKVYDVKQAATRVKIYDRVDSVSFSGHVRRLARHLSNDTSNTHFVINYPYSVLAPLATGAINADDGFLLGLGFKYTHQNGFRKVPFADVQQLMIMHSFATDAFSVHYNGEWTDAVGKANLIIKADVNAPKNTVNFFGLGDNSALDKFDGYRHYYRTRFNMYELDPALKWKTGKDASFSFGPSLQYYHMNLADNAGRFINQTSLINSYDSLTVDKDKVHAGFIANFTTNQRNNPILPYSGYYFSIDVKGYAGLNGYSRGYGQIIPEFTYYQNVAGSGDVVLSDRVGGGVTIGKPAFYQAMFLGGQGNLLGFLRNRFAGQHMLYNNLQGRVKLGDIASYILPGQLGLSGFYDAGRVWVDGEHTDKWHQGVGGGFYFAPATLTVVQVLMGHSSEGWYPYIALNFRI